MGKTLFVLLAAGAFAACGARSGATLGVTVTGAPDGTKVYLMDYTTEAALDSTVVAGGRFRFEFADAYPSGRILSFDPGEGPNRSMYYPFILEPGEITGEINLNERMFPTFAGTPTNDAVTTFMDEIVKIDDYYKELEYVEKQILDNPNTVFAAYLTESTAYGLTTLEQLDSVLNIIAGAPANDFSDRLRLRRDLLASSAVGQPALDFTQEQPDGTPFTLSSLRGKLVLIDFWASWCGPCRAENPNVVKVYEKYHDKGFEIVGVSLDASREDWLKAIEDDSLGWIHVSDLQNWNNAVGRQYGVQSIPHTVLVGADGVIIAKNLRGPALEAKIAEVLAETK